MKDLLKKLTGLYGPSGHEDAVREAIRQEIESYVDEIQVDALGNLIAHKRGQGPKLMFAAHMDEIGIVVSDIDDKGFLRFLQVGFIPHGWQLVGERVAFANGAFGVIGAEKVEEAKKTTHSKLFVDIGARNRQEAAARVGVGEMATFNRCFTDLGDRVVSKAVDDRAGCALLIQLIKQLGGAKEAPAQDLYFVFTVQEETGERGAQTAAYRVNPDLAVVVDVTRVSDTPESPRMAVSLGAGPAIKVMDQGLITHPRVKAWMMETAERAGIPYQLEVLESGVTDAKTIHLTREGVPTGVLSLPCRYIHTPSEMVDMNDVQNSLSLLAALATSSLESFVAR